MPPCQSSRRDTPKLPVAEAFLCWRTYVVVEGVAIKVPGAQELHLPASILRPGVAVDKRGVESECEDARRQEQAHQKLANHWLRW